MTNTSQCKKRFVIITPKSMSKSARALKEELSTYISAPIILVSPNSKTYQGRWTDYVINWGYSNQPEYLYSSTLNWFFDIANAVDKLETFKLLKEYDVQSVEWTEDMKTALAWQEQGDTVIGRKTLTGYGGAGILIFNKETPLTHCKLYTKYKKKKNEYRVHVFKGEVIDITQKKKKTDATNLNTKIRNYHNGWVYCRSDIFIPLGIGELAINAMKALCLGHGAVDIIWNEKEDKCYVLEINTAPGLVGTTLDKYAQAFSKDFYK